MTDSWIDACVSRGRHGFFSTSVLLTPEIATELLSRNPANRSVVASRVATYAEDIENGRWAFNGQPLIVSSDGLLTDGQHRCEAVILAGKPIETAISFGVSYESRKTTDQCRPKNAGDFAAMDGTPNAQGVAAIARMVLSLERTGNINSNRGISNAAVLEYIAGDQAALCESASFSHSRSHRLRNLVSPAVLGFCHYITNRICPEAAALYFEQIITGEGLAADDPAMAVRNRLIAMGKASRATKAEIILHGWNAYRRGQKRLLAKSLGKIPELV